MEQKRQNDPAVQQIIDRVLSQHFNVNKSSVSSGRSIAEMQDEMLKMIHEKAKFVDFAKGESCDFKGCARLD